MTRDLSNALPGDMAVLQNVSPGSWKWLNMNFNSAQGLMSLATDSSPVFTAVGNSDGQVPKCKLPLSVMDMNLAAPLTLTGNVISVAGAATSLATVATTGSYNDLSNRPTIPSGQVNSDWNASSGLAQILNKPSLAAVATSGAYSDLSGRPTALSAFTNDSGYITSSALSPYLTSASAASTYVPVTRTVNGHALSADVTVSKSDVGLGSVENTALSTWAGSTNITTLGTIVTGTWSGTAIVDAKIASASTWNAKQNAITTGTTAQYLRGDLSLATFPTAVSSFTNDSAFINQAGARSAISLTTAGTSGSATYNSGTGVLNVPTYANSGGTVTSVGVSGADFSISGSPVTTSGTIALALATSGVSAGSYSVVTVTTKGIVTAGTNQTFANAQSRTVVTNQTANGTQLSATRNARVRGIVSIQNTTTIGGPSSGAIVFEICATNSATGTDWTVVDRITSTSTATLAVVLNLVQLIENSIGGEVPAGWYSRYRAVTATGTITYSATATTQEILQ